MSALSRRPRRPPSAEEGGLAGELEILTHFEKERGRGREGLASGVRQSMQWQGERTADTIPACAAGTSAEPQLSTQHDTTHTERAVTTHSQTHTTSTLPPNPDS